MRFITNVRRWPRTFAVVCASYAATAIGCFIGIAQHRGLSVLVGIAIVATCDGLVYVWFMNDSRRVSLLLQLLDNFEGHEPITPDFDQELHEEQLEN